MFVEKSVECPHPGDTHRIVYSEFPGDAARSIICLHGLSRNGRDFEWLAQSLAAKGYRIICPDMAGRGRSAAFVNPAFYNYPQYISDITVLLAELQITQCDWIGTSMGGLIGMMLAVQPNSVIRRLVINDIGPFIPGAALERIKKYVGMNPSFTSWEDYYVAFRQRMQMFGLKTDVEWEFLAKISMEKSANGSIKMNYDTNIIAGLGADGPITDMDLWALWAMVQQPMLILHGADSDVLTNDTLHKMMVGKQATSASFAGVGHAPALLSADQISVVKNWLA